MGTNHQTEKDHEIEERRLQVSRLMLRGYTQREMANELVSSQSTICRDIEVIEEEWAAERVSNLDSLKRKHVRRLEQVIREAFVQWEDSKNDAVRQESGTGEKGSFSKTVEQGQTGNPAYLSRIMDAAKEIAETLGLHAPVKVAKTDTDGNDIPAEAGANRVSDVLSGILLASPALVARTSGNGESVDSPKPDAKTNGVPKSRL